MVLAPWRFSKSLSAGVLIFTTAVFQIGVIYVQQATGSVIKSDEIARERLGR
jgi:hypothetical protein